MIGKIISVRMSYALGRTYIKVSSITPLGVSGIYSTGKGTDGKKWISEVEGMFLWDQLIELKITNKKKL